MHLNWVLAIEDNPSDAILLQYALEGAISPLQLKCVKDGEEAINLLSDLTADHKPLPDVILVDLNLPRLDGYEVLSRLRANDDYRHVALLVLTSSGSAAERQRALSQGADGFFTKPFDLDAYRCLPRIIGETCQARDQRLQSAAAAALHGSP